MSGLHSRSLLRTTVSAFLLPTMALATGLAVPMSAASAQATRSFDIPASDLADAINSFAEQSGAQILYDAALTHGRRSAGVKGRFGTAEGLSRLIAGSGLTFRQTGTNIFTLESAPQASGNTVNLGSVRVEGSALGTLPPQPEVGTRSPVYAGGQVARGGRLGILGDRDMMDQPFNQTSYTAELIDNQQVQFVTDVLDNDPSVQTTNLSTGHDSVNMRGFYNGNGFMLFNGMQGVVSGTLSSAPAEAYERIEVLKGPNALLNGNVGKVGGVINAVPKRAGDENLTRIAVDYGMDSQFGGHADVSRRFGEEQQFGIRYNGVYRDGDTAIDHLSRKTMLSTVGMDYRGTRFRVEADLGYHEIHVDGARRMTRLNASDVVLPDAPDSRTNWFDPAEYAESKVAYGAVRMEADLGDQVMVFASGGMSNTNYRRLTANRVIDSKGTIAAGSIRDLGQRIRASSVEAGIRGTFDTGGIHHQITISALSSYEREKRAAVISSTAFPVSSIYNPVFGQSPSGIRPDLDNARKRGVDHFSSLAIVDALSAMDDRLQFTVGLRLQRVESDTFDLTTGATTAAYDEKAVTPMVGIVVKPAERLSVYANYIQGLQAGATAPDTAENAGETFAPYKTEQYEIGIKRDFGTITASLALYQIARPSAYTNVQTNIFSVTGEQRNRGVDFNLFGEVTPGVRILGGVAYIDTELRRQLVEANNGNRGTGASAWRLVAGGEWDVPFLPRLTVSARAVHTSAAYLDQANRQKAPDWTRVDLGARYKLSDGIMLRGNVENAFASDYWSTAGDGEIVLSAPRAVRLSATFDL